jgi:tyrosyl-tRNA synthetase
MKFGNYEYALISKSKSSCKIKYRKISSGIDVAINSKMSKSNPNSAIFMTDSEDDIKRKFKKAFCPEGESKDNPILEYFKYIVFEKYDSILIERPEKFGGNLEFGSYAELEKSFVEKGVHPMDLKNACSKYINELLEPIRAHFEKDKKAKKLLEQVNSFQVTR